MLLFCLPGCCVRPASGGGGSGIHGLIDEPAIPLHACMHAPHGGPYHQGLVRLAPGSRALCRALSAWADMHACACHLVHARCATRMHTCLQAWQYVDSSYFAVDRPCDFKLVVFCGRYNSIEVCGMLACMYGACGTRWCMGPAATLPTPLLRKSARVRPARGPREAGARPTRGPHEARVRAAQRAAQRLHEPTRLTHIMARMHA